MLEAMKRSAIKRITKEEIRKSCKDNHLYHTPELNDVLYLHYQGYDKIESLEEYSGLKCLWLNSNAISKICGLTSQPNLKCLFLQQNLINKIENLEMCPELDLLNLSHNHIKCVENCGSDVLPKLSSLDLSYNCLTTANSLEALKSCLKLSVLDISNNRIDDILVVKILAGMPELAVLNMMGNPVVSMIPQYRKTLILECVKLNYLDQRPIDERDRACALAWRRGGYEAEQKENDRWIKMDKDKMYQSARDTLRHRREAEKRKNDGDVSIREELCLGDTFVGRTFSEDASGMDRPHKKSSLDPCGKFPVVLKGSNSFENEEGAQNLVITEDDELSIGCGSCMSIDEARPIKSLNSSKQVEVPSPLEEGTSIDANKQDRSNESKFDDPPSSIVAPIDVEESTDKQLTSPLTENVPIAVENQSRSLTEAKVNEEDDELSIAFESCCSIDVAIPDKSLNSAEQVEVPPPLEEVTSIDAEKQDRSNESKFDDLPSSIVAPIDVEDSTGKQLISPLTEKVHITVKNQSRSLTEATVNEEDDELSIAFESCCSIDEAIPDKSLNSAEQVEVPPPLEIVTSIDADKQDRSNESKFDDPPSSIVAPIDVEESTDKQLTSPLTENVPIAVENQSRSLTEAKVNEEDDELSIAFESCCSIDVAIPDKCLNSAEQVEVPPPLEEVTSIDADKQDRSNESKFDDPPSSIVAPIDVEESTDKQLISQLTEKVPIAVKNLSRSLIEAKVNEQDDEVSIGFASCVSIDEAIPDKSLNSAEQVAIPSPSEEITSIDADKQDRNNESKIDDLPPSIVVSIDLEEQTCTMIESTDEQLILPLTEKMPVDVEKQSRSFIEAKVNDQPSLEDVPSDVNKQARSMIQDEDKGFPPSVNENVSIDVRNPEINLIICEDGDVPLPLIEDMTSERKKRSRNMIKGKDGDLPPPLVEDLTINMKKQAKNMIKDKYGDLPKPLIEDVTMDMNKRAKNINTLNDSGYKLYDDFETILREYETGDYEVVPYEIGIDENSNISGKDQPISTSTSDKNCTIYETPDDSECTLYNEFDDDSQNTAKIVSFVAPTN